MHQIPETANHEYKTAQYIRDELKKLGYKYECVHTGTIVRINNKKEKTIALRADIDGLKIQEKTQSSYCSLHEGYMHACGHDGHSAALLGFAHILKTLSPTCNIILIFQHSEEEGSGAKEIMEALKNDCIDAIFAFHIMPNIKKHKIVASDNLMMCSSEEINIDIIGKMSHVGKKKEGIDSISIASQLIKQYEFYQKGIIHIGMIKGGTARNCVCDYTSLKGTLRAYSYQDIIKIKEYISHLHNQIIKDYHCQIHTSYYSKYLPVINNKQLYKRVSSFIQLEKLDHIYMYAEDFSYYQKYIPGLFMFVGSGNTNQLHTDTFDFDEDIFETMIDTYIKIVTHL